MSRISIFVEGHDYAAAIGAAVVVFVTVVDFGGLLARLAIRARTLVVHISDVVLVVVRVGTAVLVFELVKVLGIVDAQVILIGDAVLVVVELGAAVFILETIKIFWIIRALVDVIRDAVAIAIVVILFGAAVFVLDAVFVLRLIRGTCHRRRGCRPGRYPDRGQPVLVLEAVFVFRPVRTLVDVILDAVAVSVPRCSVRR